MTEERTRERRREKMQTPLLQKRKWERLIWSIDEFLSMDERWQAYSIIFVEEGVIGEEETARAARYDDDVGWYIISEQLVTNNHIEVYSSYIT